MSIGILGQKVGMTRVYDEAGTITPVTVILAEPNAVLQVKTLDNDGYTAAQLGVFDQKEHRVTKPELGHFKKAGSAPKRFVREFTTNGDAVKQGDSITVNRSPHVDKKSMDQFEMRTHKRLLDIIQPTAKTVDELKKLNLPAGVDIKIKV